MTTIADRSMALVEFTAFCAVTLGTTTISAIRSLAASAVPKRTVYATPVSVEWLQSNAIESAKHGDDC